MSDNSALLWVGTLGGIAAFIQAVWVVVAAVRGRTAARGRAEADGARATAARAVIDVAQAEQSLPHVQESLRLGNISDAVTIQQNIINGLHEHIRWQDEQIAERDRRIKALEDLTSELEARLETAEAALGEAREAFNALRANALLVNDDGTMES